MKKLFCSLITSAGLLAVPLLANSAGIQVSPARLEFSVSGAQKTIQNITVVNPTANVQLFEVYPDDFTTLITANPESFTLESGAQKTVNVSVIAQPGQAEGSKLSTNLSVIGKALADNQFSVGTGVKIPLTITLASTPQNHKSSQWPFWAGTAVLAIALFGVMKYKNKSN